MQSTGTFTDACLQQSEHFLQAYLLLHLLRYQIFSTSWHSFSEKGLRPTVEKPTTIAVIILANMHAQKAVLPWYIIQCACNACMCAHVCLCANIPALVCSCMFVVFGCMDIPVCRPIHTCILSKNHNHCQYTFPHNTMFCHHHLKKS